MSPSLSRQMAEFAHNLRFEHIPQVAVHEAKRFLLDSLGCALAAVQNEDMQAMYRFTDRLGGTPEATIIGNGRRTNAPNAALMNCLLIRALDYNDIYQHSKLRPHLQSPLCLDESIHSAANTQFAIEIHACDIINIKPSRVGGWTEARDVHDLCYAASLKTWVGGMLETGVGRAAQLALASLLFDVVMVSLLLMTFGGLDSGLGVLLLFISAAAAILLPLREALFIASLATIGIVGEAAAALVSHRRRSTVSTATICFPCSGTTRCRAGSNRWPR